MSSGSTLHSQAELSKPEHHPEPEGETTVHSSIHLCVCLTDVLSHSPFCLPAGLWSHFLSSDLLPKESCLSAHGPEHHSGSAGSESGCLHGETLFIVVQTWTAGDDDGLNVSTL